MVVMSAAESRRVAVVTGAASGIGKAIAARFIWDGYWVGLLDRDEAAAAAALQDLGGADHGTVLPADVSDEAAMAAAFQRVRDQWGRLDVLVNNAALPQRPTPIDSLTSAEWDRLMAVNVKGVFLGIKFAVPLMRDRGGSIINIASVAALRPRPGLNAYCASKAAVIGLTQAVALELAGTGIRVNGIAPGPADTPMLPGFMADPGSAAGRQAFIDSVPLGRLIRPEEIAAAAAYLASDEAAAVIGAILNVDGGRHVEGDGGRPRSSRPAHPPVGAPHHRRPGRAGCGRRDVPHCQSRQWPRPGPGGPGPGSRRGQGGGGGPARVRGNLEPGASGRARPDPGPHRGRGAGTP